jgi:hypothetical protein
MRSMGSMATNAATSSVPDPHNLLFRFWGELILLISFGLMLAGTWFTGNRKVMPLSIAAMTILYISMYIYFSISLEIMGVSILSLAY